MLRGLASVAAGLQFEYLSFFFFRNFFLSSPGCKRNMWQPVTRGNCIPQSSGLDSEISPGSAGSNPWTAECSFRNFFSFFPLIPINNRGIPSHLLFSFSHLVAQFLTSAPLSLLFSFF